MPSVIKRFEEFTGGGSGINLFGLPELTGVDHAGRDPRARAHTSTTGSTTCAGRSRSSLFAVAWLILRGRTGRAFRAVRDSETAAVSSGVSLAQYKTLAFGISAAYAGVAGSLFAIATTFVNPDTFPIALSIFLLVGVVVGGLGGLSGLVFGAIFIQFLPLWAQGEGLARGCPTSSSRRTKEPGGAGHRLRRRPHPARCSCSRTASAASSGARGRHSTRRRYSRSARNRHSGGDPDETTARPRGVAVVACALALGRAARRGSRAPTADPGITSTTILLGGTSPLTGPAAAYASVARGAKAYFDSVNAQGRRREAEDRVQDRRRRLQPGADGARRRASSSSRTRSSRSSTRSGPSTTSPIREYLNQAKVPQLFVASGATTWGRDAARYPWTIGFQPSYQAEGWVYGQYVAQTKKKARIAVLFQNDDYGKDLLAGLKRGIARSGAKDRRRGDLRGDRARRAVADRRSSRPPRANMFAVFATPKFAIQSYVFANRLSWRPLDHQQHRLRRLEHHGARLRGREEQGGQRLDHAQLPQGPDRPEVEEGHRDAAVPHDHGALREGRERQRRLPRVRHGGRATRRSRSSGGSARTRPARG